MKQEFLKELGLADDVIAKIQAESGKEITALKSTADEWKSKHDNAQAELKKFDKGGEKYIDTAEIEALRKFKIDTETAQVRSKKESAVMSLLKDNKVSEKALKLLLKGVELDKIELSDDGKVKDADKIIAPIKTEYADFFVTEQPGGANPANPAPNTNTGNGEVSLKSAVAEKLGKK